MKSCEDGISVIKKMVEIGNNNIIIMAGGGVNENNINKIIILTGIKEIHGSGIIYNIIARIIKKSKMLYKKSDLFMGSDKINNEESEYIYKVADPIRIKAFKDNS